MTQAFNLSQLANKVNSSGQLDVASGATGTLPVSNGGTGLTAVGTNGNVLTSNGTAWVSSAPTSGQLQYALYTSGTTTWTAPTGVTKIKVVCIGGGGGGGQPADNDGGDAGDGGFGGVAIGIYTVTPGTGYSAVVGSGGAISSSGGTSSLGSLISATGGGGGGAANPGGPGSNGANGAGSSGTTANTFVGGSTVYPTCIYTFMGYSAKPRGTGTSAVAWSSTIGYLPGSRGYGQSLGSPSQQTAGVGGVVYIEYVG